MFVRRPFLAAFRSPARQGPRVERILAVSRAFFTATALGAIYVDPTEPARFAALTYTLLAAYAGYSLAVLMFLPRLLRVRQLNVALHGADIVWTSVLTVFSEGPVSPFFLFFLFVMLAAAYRWGLRETVGTAVVIVVVFALETLAESAPFVSASQPFEATPLVIRATYLLLTGALLGYLAEQDKSLRAEVAAINDAVAIPSIDAGFSGSVTRLTRFLREVFDAAGVDVVVHDLARGRTSRWEAERALDGRRRASFKPVSLGEHGQERWLFKTPARTWCSAGPVRGSTVTAVALDPQSSTFGPTEIALSGPLTVRRSFSTVAAVDFGLTGEWAGRIYLYDPAHMPHGLHFLESLTDSVTPVLSNVFLLRRLRSRVGAAERARVARELHDGAIQSLIGIEMDAQAIRATAEAVAPSLSPDLQRIQGLLRQEVLDLRELMQQLQPVGLEMPHHLPDLLGAIVERFRRDTGIAARYLGEASTGALTLRSTHEVVRIVQEALANVRKHSQAQSVVVELMERDGGLCVSIEDDGRGFPFDGTLSGSDLLASRMAPAVIYQRARRLGGTVTVASKPGAGARVEVAFSGVRRS